MGLLAPAAAVPDPSPAVWRMLDGNPQHTRGISVTVRPPLRLLWKTKSVPSSDQFNNIYPASAAEHSVYLVSVEQRRVYIEAVDCRSGQSKWKTYFGRFAGDPRGGGSNSRAALPVLAEGRVFLAVGGIATARSAGWVLLALNSASGKIEWEFDSTIDHRGQQHEKITSQELFAPDSPYEVSFIPLNLYDGRLVTSNMQIFNAATGKFLWDCSVNAIEPNPLIFDGHIAILKD